MATPTTLLFVRVEITFIPKAEEPLAVPSSGRAGFARASVCSDRSRRDIEAVTLPKFAESRVRRFFRRKARRRAAVSGWRDEATLRSLIRA
jgi:hypothetical protein